MTLQQLPTFTAACEPSDVRRAMVAALARERPRTADEYRRFYEAVCLQLTTSRHGQVPRRRPQPAEQVLVDRLPSDEVVDRPAV